MCDIELEWCSIVVSKFPLRPLSQAEYVRGFKRESSSSFGGRARGEKNREIEEEVGGSGREGEGERERVCV